MVLYSLFESVLVFKPFASSVISEGQFVVCKGLRDLESAKQVATKLMLIYSKVYESEADLTQLIDFNLIEKEDALL